MATIKNLTRRMRAYNVPELGMTRSLVSLAERDGASGSRSVRSVEKEHPNTITLCSKGTKGDIVNDLPEEVADSPEIASAIRRGEIALIPGLPAPPAAPVPDSNHTTLNTEDV